MGEIMKTDAKLRSLTGGITTPRRLLVSEVMEIDTKLRPLTGGIMTPRRLGMFGGRWLKSSTRTVMTCRAHDGFGTFGPGVGFETRVVQSRRFLQSGGGHIFYTVCA